MNDRLRDRFRFRVWDEENHILHILQDGKKYDCDSVEIAFDGSLIGTSFNDEIERKEHSISYLGGENCVLEQCTGLKDKNGKLIYEGDIVKMEADCMCADIEQVGIPCIVEWGDFGFYFHYPQIEGEKETAAWNECAEYEVIGNIHENPELLEGE